MGAALHLCSVVLRSGCQLPVADRPAEAFPFHDAFLGRTDGGFHHEQKLLALGVGAR